MHRISMAAIVLMAALFTVPASAQRTIRVDLFNCSDPANLDPSILYCWGNVPFGSTGPVLPTDGSPGTVPPDSITPDPSAPAIAPLAYAHFQPGFDFRFNTFYIDAFDYGQFLIDIGNPTGAGLALPVVQVTQGLARVDDPANDNPFTIPMLRINWLLDPALAAYTNIFQPSLGEINGTTYFGVQLIFYGDDPSFATGNGLPTPPVPGISFEINGLKDTLTYTSDTLWHVDNDGVDRRTPCSSFDIDGQALCAPTSVPEPSTFALLGLGFLALAFRARSRGFARARLS